MDGWSRKKRRVFVTKVWSVTLLYWVWGNRIHQRKAWPFRLNIISELRVHIKFNPALPSVPQFPRLMIIHNVLSAIEITGPNVLVCNIGRLMVAVN